MNARSADFAATAPWSGITGKPSAYPTDPALLSPGSARDQSLLIFDSAQARWVPVTPQDLLDILRPFLRLTAADVGLGNVDDTSDEQKNAATATLTNKTLLGAILLLIQQLGLRSPTGFNLFLATGSLLSADRTLLLLVDDADRSLTLQGGDLIISLSDGTGSDEDRTLSLDGDLTVRVNQAPRTLDLAGDLTLRGGDLIVELSDGTGAGEDRILSLDGDLTIRVNGDLRTLNLGGDITLLNGSLVVDAYSSSRTLNLNGSFSLLDGSFSVDSNEAIRVLSLEGDLTLAGAFAATFTFTGTTGVTFPTSGTLANTIYVDAGDAATLSAAAVNAAAGDAATLVSANAVSATKQPLTGNSFAVAGLPAAASNVGRVVYCTNGDAGAPCAAISDGTNWKVIAIGATVST